MPLFQTHFAIIHYPSHCFIFFFPPWLSHSGESK